MLLWIRPPVHDALERGGQKGFPHLFPLLPGIGFARHAASAPFGINKVQNLKSVFIS